MRPVVKGAAPNTYSEHGKARGDLVSRIGRYCCYCEMAVNNMIQVEHVESQSLVPELKKAWDNFLLACGYCNSTKSNKPIDLMIDAFPHLDNLLMGIKVKNVGLEVRTGLPQHVHDMAENFLGLVGLDVDPKTQPKRDRWGPRFEVLFVIASVVEDLSNDPTNISMKNLAVTVARGYGHFSMWMEAFKDDVDMKLRLINAFPGTALDCFDANGDPIPRPDGKM